MKIVSKDFCAFTGVYIAIYIGPYRRSYILLVRKFQTSEMMDKWSPTSKLSDIKLSRIPDDRYIFFTCKFSTCPPYQLNLCCDILNSFSVFIMIESWRLDNVSTLPI